MRILISGGRSDIGRALVERRAAKEDHVATTFSKSDEKLIFTKPVETFHFNLAGPQENSQELQDWISQGIDGLILNAATQNRSLRKIHEYEQDEIESSLSANIYGNIWLLQKSLSQMVKQNFGRILYISSMTVHGSARYGLYSAGKAAIEGLMKSVATDYGENNITANIIRPSVFETSRTKRFWKRTSYVEVMIPLIPLMRFGQPADLAVASDLFMDVNCYANGSVLELSGGLPQIRPDSLFKVGL
jgi:3-oxoacyl-[acyl-carrier protein] reductase